ncbi:MAG: EAL domain-containing protein [Gammaproteobacteria bacterium]|nr:EAL domain-containing protein [Gammaproteobacteria bacterium]
MKSRSVADKPTLKILLAVKGQADNLDMLRPIKLFTDARIEITNPRSTKEFAEALDQEKFDAMICDHHLFGRRSLPKISSLREQSTAEPLITFAHNINPELLKEARSLHSLHTFVIKDLGAAGLHNLIFMTLKYALLCQVKTQGSHNHPLFKEVSRSYVYHSSIDKQGRMQTDWMSDSFEDVTGYARKDVSAKGGWIACVHKEDLPAIKEFTETLISNKTATTLYRATKKNGETIWLESVGQPEWDEANQQVVGITGGSRDVTERVFLQNTLDMLNRQQNATIRLGEIASTEPELPELLRQTTILVTQTLDAWLCEIFLIGGDGTEGVLHAGMGLESKQVGNFKLPLNRDNEFKYIIENKEPVLSDDLRKEKRFRPSAHLRRNKVLSGICAPIRAGAESIGMLAVYSNRTDAFDHDNLNFVHAMATMVAAFTVQHSTEFRLRNTRQVLVEQTSQLHRGLDDSLAQKDSTHTDDDISVIVKTAKELRSRDIILSATSRATGRLIDATDWQTSMSEVLEELGRASNASRCYISHVSSNDGRSNMQFEWVNAGIQPCMENTLFRNMSLEEVGLGQFIETLGRGGILVGSTDEFGKHEQNYFKKLGVLSTAIVPIFIEEKWWGYLGFDDCHERRSWSTAEIDALHIAANTISTALARRQNDAALQAIQEGTVSKTGEDYFQSLLTHLIGIFEADYCLIAQAIAPNRFRINNALRKGELIPPFEYQQQESNFDNANTAQIIHFTDGVNKVFSENKWLRDNKIEGYLAIPVTGNDKSVLGHIAVMSTKRLEANARELQILNIFAARVGVELERQRMEKENLQLARISLENPNMVMIADLAGKILFSNPACSKMVERLNIGSVESLLPENHIELIEQTQASGDEVIRVERAISDYHFQWNYYLQSDLNRIHIYAIDMTRYRLMEEQLRKDAFHDPLTGLPNRNYFNSLLEHAIERTSRRNDYEFAVLYLDLDRFKYINDSLGHAYGDKFLETVAQVLKNCLRPGDYIARLGGDEFAILLDAVPNEQEVTNIASRIQQVLSKPIRISKHETFTSASIGIAMSARGYNNPQDILRDADIAMYSAKQSGRARYALFDGRMHEEMVHVMRLEVDLRHALQNNELHVYYQPIYSIAEKCLAGMEALVRWNHPERGFLEPHDFIMLAEEMSIIRDIDYLVLKQATKQLKQWRKKYEAAKNIKIHVNMSGIHFNSTAVLAEIGNVLKDNKLSNDSLQLELTESVIMDNTGRSGEIFNILSKLGVHISIDDFGVGYSSLSRLTKLPVDMLKIDRGFVQSMIVDSSSLNITRAVIDLAHDLNMEVIAEGVETQGQYQILGRMGCQYAQGFYISKPMTAEEADVFLSNPPVMQTG